MTDKKIRKMIMEILEQVDYDIYKQYLPGYSDYPEETELNMQGFIKTASKYINGKTKTNKK